jgi:hypothetical protein
MANPWGGPANRVSGGVTDDHTDDRGKESVEDGISENDQPGGVETVKVVLQREVVDHPSQIIPLAETGEDEKPGGQRHKDPQPDQERGQE